MAVGEYVIASGTYTAEEDLATSFFDFLTNTLGWTELDTVTDTSSDKDRVFLSEGEVPGKYMPIYARARGNASDFELYGYTFWDSGSSTGNDEMYESADSYFDVTGPDDYFFIGNGDVAYISAKEAGSPRLGGFGYLDTYYTASQDPLPLFTIGQQTDSLAFYSDRILAYKYSPDGFLASGSTTSGSFGFYYQDGVDNLARAGASTTRDGRHIFIKPILYSATLPAEVRGELPGLYQLEGTSFVHGDLVTASGVTTTASGIPEGSYFICKTSNTICYAIGPITNV